MLKSELKDKQIQALKSGDSKKLTLLRYILSQIQNKEIEKKQELTEGEITTTLRQIAKEIKESIGASITGNRQDMLKNQQEELAIVTSYLPPEMSEEDLLAEVKKIVNKNDELHKTNPKALIGICVRELKSRAAPDRIVGALNSLS